MLPILRSNKRLVELMSTALALVKMMSYASIKDSYQTQFVLPFALSERPACDDPERDHEDEQHRARTDGHQGLQDEPRVEVDPVQGADAAGARVGKQLGVEQHYPRITNINLRSEILVA